MACLLGSVAPSVPRRGRPLGFFLKTEYPVVFAGLEENLLAFFHFRPAASDHDEALIVEECSGRALALHVKGATTTLDKAVHTVLALIRLPSRLMRTAPTTVARVVPQSPAELLVGP
jgi:hypothetical protein